jgi:hypothetical protein
MTEQSRAECRFFQRLTYRLGADRIDKAEDHHLVSQQLLRPMASATRRVRAGQLDQFLLDISFDLDLVWACRLWPVIDRRLQSFGDKSSSDPSDRPQSGAQGCDDFVVGVANPMHPICQQQDTGMGQLPLADSPLRTRPSRAARSSGPSVTRYFSITVLLHLMCILQANALKKQERA